MRNQIEDEICRIYAKRGPLGIAFWEKEYEENKKLEAKLSKRPLPLAEIEIAFFTYRKAVLGAM